MIHFTRISISSLVGKRVCSLVYNIQLYYNAWWGGDKKIFTHTKIHLKSKRSAYLSIFLRLL